MDGWFVFEKFIVPTLERVAAAYEIGEPVYPKVMLAKVRAGGRIKPHIDTYLYANQRKCVCVCVCVCARV